MPMNAGSAEAAYQIARYLVPGEDVHVMLRKRGAQLAEKLRCSEAHGFVSLV